MRNLILVGMALAAVGRIAAPPAAAQDLVKDPAVIARCLCERQQLDALQNTMDERRQRYESGQQTLAALDRDLAARRSAMSVMDPTQIDAYKKLLQQRDSAAAALSAGVIPDYNAALARYGAARTDYDSSCGAQSFDRAVYDRVEASLSCPKP